MANIPEVRKGVSEGNVVGGTGKTVLIAVTPCMETTAICSVMLSLSEFTYSSKTSNPFLQHRSDPEQ